MPLNNLATLPALTLAVANAANSAVTAATAATTASAASTAANAIGKVFVTIALGLSGTTSGQSFSVLSADLLTLVVYTNTAGAATPIFQFRTKAFLDSLGFDTSYAVRVGYAAAWMDASNNLALGISNDGRVIFGHGGDVATRLDNLEVLTDQSYSPRSGYVWGVVGQNNGMSIGILPNGHIIFGHGGDVATRLDLLEGSSITTSNVSSNRSGYFWAWEDSAGNLAGGIDVAGNLISKGLNLTTQAATQTAIVASNSKWITPTGFWWYGDSLSASGAPGWLSSYLGLPVTVGAVGGQTAQQIASRFGGQISFFTIAGNTIPASGPVAVITRSIEIITAQNAGSWTGKLFGIAGTYASDGATTWTFTRTTPGTALAIDPATPFFIDITDNRMFGTVVFWYGRNNVGTSTFNADVKQAISDSIAQLKTLDQRFIVLSVLNWPTEIIGTANHDAVVQLNSDLKALYPRNYVEVRNLLIRNGNGSAQDNADVANDVVPTSLRNSITDGHLNNTTGNPIVATRVFQFLNEKGWLE